MRKNKPIARHCKIFERLNVYLNDCGNAARSSDPPKPRHALREARIGKAADEARRNNETFSISPPRKRMGGHLQSLQRADFERARPIQAFATERKAQSLKKKKSVYTAARRGPVPPATTAPAPATATGTTTIALTLTLTISCNITVTLNLLMIITNLTVLVNCIVTASIIQHLWLFFLSEPSKVLVLRGWLYDILVH